MRINTILMVVFLFLSNVNVAKSSFNLGVINGTDFDKTSYFGLDLGVEDDLILYKVGFSRYSAKETNFVSEIVYNLYDSHKYSIYAGAGIEDSDFLLTYGVNYNLTKSMKLEFGMRTILESNRYNQQEGYVGVRFYANNANNITDVLPLPDEDIPLKEITETKGLVSEDDSVFLENYEVSSNLYVIKEGDWLLKISRELNVELETLLMLNPDILEPNIIYPNQVIRISK